MHEWRNRRAAVLAAGTVAWLIGFAVLSRTGSWITFAVTGIVIASVAIATGAVPRMLLRPTLRTVTAGIAGGLCMVGLTHASYALVTPRIPAAAAASTELFALLRVSGFAVTVRAVLIVLIATCEEIMFRGTMPTGRDRATATAGATAAATAATVTAFALLYAAATVTLGSPLLVLVAFLCGMAWGFMRVASASLVVPILAHVVWDLGVLVIWPLR